MNPDLKPGDLAKPLPGSGRLQRRKNRTARKRGLEPETHADTLARVAFWRALRLELYERDRGLCRACQQPLDLEAGIAANALHAHHVIHRSAGGQDVLANLASLCSGCHRLHHDGRLSIFGEPNGTLEFTLRGTNGRLVRAWHHTVNG